MIYITSNAAGHRTDAGIVWTARTTMRALFQFICMCTNTYKYKETKQILPELDTWIATRSDDLSALMPTVVIPRIWLIKLPSITNSIEMNVSKELRKPLCFNITLNYIATTKDYNLYFV